MRQVTKYVTNDKVPVEVARIRECLVIHSVPTIMIRGDRYIISYHTDELERIGNDRTDYCVTRTIVVVKDGM